MKLDDNCWYIQLCDQKFLFMSGIKIITTSDQD